MDAEILQGFIRQAEEYLPSIRGGILACAHAGNVYGEIDACLRQIDAVKNAASIIDLTEIVNICGEFRETLKTVSTAKEPLADEKARELFDKLAALEAVVTGLYFSDDRFSENLDGFVEDSFEEFRDDAEKNSDAGDNGEKFQIDAETLEVFAFEAADLLRNIRANLARLEKSPGDGDALPEIRRRVHTLKGSAAIVGLDRLSRLAHRVEDLLDCAANQRIDCDAETLRLLSTSTECFEFLARDDDSAQIREKIARVYENFDAAITSLQKRAAPKTNAQANRSPLAAKVSKDSTQTVETQNRSVVRVSVDKLDDLFRLAGDLTAGRAVFNEHIAQFERSGDEFSRPTAQPDTDFQDEKDADATFYQSVNSRTSRDNLSPIINFDESNLLELGDCRENAPATAKNEPDAAGDGGAFNLLKNNFEALFDNQQRLIEEMRGKLLRLRMISFGSLSARLQRTVRLACEEEEKSADLFIDGANLEIDTQVLDCLIEPLLHLLRNAVAHGIEAPELRLLLGKPERGKISVRARSEKGRIVVAVSDDGRGISADALKETAVDSDFISRDEAERMDSAEAFELMFLPGLTTAGKLSRISGRGVGMNVVKTCIERHQGDVSVSTEAQKETTVTLRVPSALTIARVVFVRARERVFALPLNLVKHIGKISGGEFSAAPEALLLGDENYPLFYLNAILEIAAESFTEHERVSVLFLKSAEIEAALAVDKILKTDEIVISQTERFSPDNSDLLGTTIYSDGSVVPVLDLIRLFKDNTKSERGKTNPGDEKTTLFGENRHFDDFPGLSVLIVDDSRSVRRAVSDLIKDVGWQPIVAGNGLEALAILRTASRLPDIILTDAEMPLMDGCEFLNALKELEPFRLIPVLMITSLDDEDFLRKAFEAGASDYLKKPFEDKLLLSKIKNLTNI